MQLVLKRVIKKMILRKRINSKTDLMVLDPYSGVVTQEWFNPDYWERNGAVTGYARGRNIAVFFQYEDVEFVYKQYKRGGLVARLVANQYFYLGMENTRAVRELRLLEALNGLFLPVPEPVAVKIAKKGLFYSADLITKRIPGGIDLCSILQKEPVKKNTWRQIGECIKLFHDAGVYHADLNIRNLLLDQNGKVWLIDFDRCSIKGGGAKKGSANQGQGWKDKNIFRFERSLLKEKRLQDQFCWDKSDFSSFMEGYTHLS